MNAESTREALDVASLAGDILLASGAEIQRCVCVEQWYFPDS